MATKNQTWAKVKKDDDEPVKKKWQTTQRPVQIPMQAAPRSNLPIGYQFPGQGQPLTAPSPTQQFQQWAQVQPPAYNPYGPTYNPAQSQGMWNTLGPTNKGPTQVNLRNTPAGQFLNPDGTINTQGAMPLRNVLIAPELQFLPGGKEKLQSARASQAFADSYTEALANMIFQGNDLPPEAPAYSYDYYGGGGGGGGGGGYDYSKAPYAWMSKLLNWNVNR